MPSSVIHDFDYDPDSQELTIEFKTSRIYIYFAVPQDAFAAFSAARSRGGHFNRHIRDRYKFREVIPSPDHYLGVIPGRELKAREPGIHNPRCGVWIPGSPLRGAPE